METLKQFLAFPLYATVAWLIWVLSFQVGPPGLLAALAALVLIAFGAWAYRPVAGAERCFGPRAFKAWPPPRSPASLRWPS